MDFWVSELFSVLDIYWKMNAQYMIKDKENNSFYFAKMLKRLGTLLIIKSYGQLSIFTKTIYIWEG